MVDRKRKGGTRVKEEDEDAEKRMEVATEVVRIEDTRKRSWGGLHPLAGRAGFGPPIAPPGWRWRAGRRLSDTRFFSPDGKPFHSRIKLLKYLAETPGTPSLSQFRYHVTADDFKDGPIPGKPVLFPRSKYRPENVGDYMNKRVKQVTQEDVKPKLEEDILEISDELPTHFHATDLLAEETKVVKWKSKVELYCAELVQAEKLADEQRIKLHNAIEAVKKVEEEAILRAKCSRSSKRNLHRAERRLRLLKTNCRNRVLPEQQIEEQRTVVNIESSELCEIQRKGRSISYESGDFSTDKFQSILDGLKIQKRRVRSAQAMLRHLLALDKLFH